MRWRLLLAVLTLSVCTGCHRVTGYGDNKLGEGTMRHYFGLDIAYRMTMVLCAVGLVAGIALVVDSVIQSEGYEWRQTTWGTVLIVIATVVGVRLHSNLGNIGYCC